MLKCLQAAILQHNESEALPPKALQEKITKLLSSNPDLAEAVSVIVISTLKY